MSAKERAQQKRDEAAYLYLKRYCPRLLKIARNPFTDPIREKFPTPPENRKGEREYEDPEDEDHSPGYQWRSDD